VFHEPENDIDEAFNSGMTPSDYVAMYRHVVGRLRSLEVDNVVYVMNFMGFDRWSTVVDDLYPGDDVVDWIAYDPYGLARHTSFAEVINDANDDGWPGFYDWATTKAPGKPIMLAEWGLDPEQHDLADEIVQDVPRSLRDEFPMIKAVVYWNDRGERVDARLREDTEVSSRFAEAFRAIASDSYFNDTSADQAP
jgi:beta-mannanase